MELDNPIDTEPASPAPSSEFTLPETAASTSQDTARLSPSIQQEGATRASPPDNNLKRKVLVYFLPVKRIVNES